MWFCVFLTRGCRGGQLGGPAPGFLITLIEVSFNLRSPTLVTVGIALTDGKFGAYMQVHIQNDGPVTIELESPAPGAATSDPKQVSPESRVGSVPWQPVTSFGLDLVPGALLSLRWRKRLTVVTQSLFATSLPENAPVARRLLCAAALPPPDSIPELSPPPGRSRARCLGAHRPLGGSRGAARLPSAGPGSRVWNGCVEWVYSRCG